MKVFLTGGTGFIGRKLIQELLDRGDQIRVVSRSAGKATRMLGPRVEVIENDPSRPGPWIQAMDGCDAVVNLAGEPIADRSWSEAQKRRLHESRIEVTRLIVEGLKNARIRPKVLISASAVGYYGDRGDQEIDEAVPPARDFVGELCSEWEQAALAAEPLGVRVVLLRIGIVLDRTGGALEKMLLPFKLFVGGPMGGGKQWFPWIHRDDLVGLILFSLERHQVQGPVNGVAPGITTMAGFARTLGRVLHRPSWLPVPAAALRLAMGDRAGILLASQRVVPKRALELGYRFKFPELEPALRDCLE